MSTLDRLADLAPERVRPLKRVEFERLASDGAFDDERVELLGGVIVEMSPRSTAHAAAIMQLTKRLARAAGDLAEIRVQLPFAASDESLPEPDVALVQPGTYRTTHPTAAFLLVEVARESLNKDRRLKSALYARAAVPEYWVVNLVERCVDVHTAPQDGAYSDVRKVGADGFLILNAFGRAKLLVSDILGEP